MAVTSCDFISISLPVKFRFIFAFILVAIHCGYCSLVFVVAVIITVKSSINPYSIEDANYQNPLVANFRIFVASSKVEELFTSFQFVANVIQNILGFTEVELVNGACPLNMDSVALSLYYEKQTNY